MNPVRRTKAALALALLVGSVPAFAADLMEIYRQALASDPVYSAARASWNAAQEKLPQGLAGLLPQATLSASTHVNGSHGQGQLRLGAEHHPGRLSAGAVGGPTPFGQEHPAVENGVAPHRVVTEEHPLLAVVSPHQSSRGHPE